MKIGIIAGAFDIIHRGYIDMFKEAKIHCDKLIIALHDDPSIERNDKLKPVNTVVDREIILRSIIFVDYIYVYKSENDLVEIIKTIKPDIRFLGDDYRGKDYTGSDLGIPIHYINRNHGLSTTSIKENIYKQMKIRNNKRLI